MAHAPHDRHASLFAVLALAASLATAPARAESLHGEFDATLPDRLLTTLAEDLRGNRLVVSIGTEDLRALLAQGLCLADSASCHAATDAPHATGLMLTPAQLDLLQQQVDAWLRARNPSLQFRRPQTASLPEPYDHSDQPLASL